MSDIFLSYARVDRPRVKLVADALQQAGWSVWWDHTILPGKTWDQAVEAALGDARCVIVLWSRDSIHSDWVQTEAYEGKRRGILVPALLDDVSIPLAFRRIQAANLVAWSGVLPHAGLDELSRAVSEVLSVAGPLVIERTSEAQPAEEAARSPKAEGATPRGAGTDGLVNEAGQERFAAVAQNYRSRLSAILTRSRLSKRMAIFGILAVALIAIVIYTQTHPKTSVPATRINPVDGLTYAFIPPGNSMMGCSPGDNECDSDEKPPRAEQIANGFWLGQTEVTQAAWKKVNGSNNNPSRFESDQLPVEQVDWAGAQKYCQAVAGRLPSEKEWEYAARAGTRGSRYGDLDAIAWYSGNSDRATHSVGLKQPNAFGLYDMLGNVWEWTADNYDSNTKVVRGGSWNVYTRYARASSRLREGPAHRSIYLGFRCVGEFR
ncbi:MAG: SUMF1/EgtB/PvdO family nonheme iron enzyme [Bryobacteraceae bacterium]